MSMQPSMIRMYTDGTCTAEVVCSARNYEMMRGQYLSDEDVLKSCGVDGRELWWWSIDGVRHIQWCLTTSLP